MVKKGPPLKVYLSAAVAGITAAIVVFIALAVVELFVALATNTRSLPSPPLPSMAFWQWALSVVNAVIALLVGLWCGWAFFRKNSA